MRQWVCVGITLFKLITLLKIPSRNHLYSLQPALLEKSWTGWFAERELGSEGFWCFAQLTGTSPNTFCSHLQTVGTSISHFSCRYYEDLLSTSLKDICRWQRSVWLPELLGSLSPPSPSWGRFQKHSWSFLAVAPELLGTSLFLELVGTSRWL